MGTFSSGRGRERGAGPFRPSNGGTCRGRLLYLLLGGAIAWLAAIPLWEDQSVCCKQKATSGSVGTLLGVPLASQRVLIAVFCLDLELGSIK